MRCQGWAGPGGVPKPQQWPTKITKERTGRSIGDNYASLEAARLTCGWRAAAEQRLLTSWRTPPAGR